MKVEVLKMIFFRPAGGEVGIHTTEISNSLPARATQNTNTL